MFVSHLCSAPCVCGVWLPATWSWGSGCIEGQNCLGPGRIRPVSPSASSLHPPSSSDPSTSHTEEKTNKTFSTFRQQTVKMPQKAKHSAETSTSPHGTQLHILSVTSKSTAVNQTDSSYEETQEVLFCTSAKINTWWTSMSFFVKCRRYNMKLWDCYRGLLMLG